jgi:Icc protein
MKRRTNLLILGILSLVVATAQVRADDELPRRVRFGLIADVHQDVMPDAMERIRSFAGVMTEAKVDFVVQLGDFCQPHPRNQVFLDAWNTFAGPRYHVLGNHDMDGGFAAAQTAAFYGIPGPHYAFAAGPVCGLVLNGNEGGGKASGYKRFIGEQQLAWLDQELTQSQRPVLIFIHQPLDDPRGIENGDAVRAVIEKAKAKVVAVFSGHLHEDYERVVNGVRYIQINSASYVWLTGKAVRETFPPEVHKAHPYLRNVAAYQKPLWAIVTLDLERGTLEIEGKRSEWIGPDPWQRGASGKEYRPDRTRPGISDRQLPLEVSVK